MAAVGPLRDLLALAARAPSLRNSQPWRFDARPGQVDVWADLSRSLPASDPTGREVAIACGATVCNLRVGLRARGHRPTVALVPDDLEPTLVARVSWDEEQRGDVDPDARRLLPAIYRRHTHRGRFTGRPLDPELAESLERAAAAEGGGLHFVSPADLDWLARLVQTHERRAAGNARIRNEGHWLEQSVPRTSGLFSRSGGVPAAAVLWSGEDDLRAWLRSGQALQCLLLVAAEQWAFASLHTQPLEDDDARRRVAARLELPGSAQAILRIGYAPVAPTTPRREVSELELSPASG